MNRYASLFRPTSALATAAILAAAAHAQVYQPPAIVPQVASAEAFPALTTEQLDTLVGAIALYPDALIAQILPASTYPVDVVKAARLVRAGASDAQIEQQDWDPSVKAVAHYPSVIEMMDQSLDWTQQLGQAFITQPSDVMQSIQRQRARAQTVGSLVSTPQQQMLIEEQVIRIVPANPEIIYVPVYDPAIVYYQPPVYGPSISFGFGYRCGIWFDLDIDWFHFWCYRPGWTWNHWRDHYIVEHDRFIRPRHDFEPHRGDHPAPPPTVWRRDEHKPITLPGRRMVHPSEFDRFRGRNHGETHAPTPTVIHTPTGIDRGRSPGTPTAPPLVTRPRDDRGQPGRPSRPTPPTASPKPTPAPTPEAKPAPTPRPAPSPTPQPSPTPRPAGDTHRDPGQTVRPSPAPAPVTRPPGDTHIEPGQTVRPQPAKVAPPPVRVSPPPPAATRPSPPPYVRPSQPQKKDDGKGRR